MQLAFEEDTHSDRGLGNVVRTADMDHPARGSNRTAVPRPGRDWTVVGRCPECKGPVVKLRRENDYAEQTEHRKGCSRA